MRKFTEFIKSPKGGVVCIALFFALIVSTPILAGVINTQKNKPTFVQGNFSKYTCSETGCNSPAAWRYSYYQRNTYYCDAHSDVGSVEYEKATTKESKSTKDSLNDEYGHDKYDAAVVAKTIVKDNLKSPSTAEFCKTSECAISCSGNTWTVSGYVDAQNSFGAVLRNNFKVKFTFTTSNKYTIDSYSIN